MHYNIQYFTWRWSVKERELSKICFCALFCHRWHCVFPAMSQQVMFYSDGLRPVNDFPSTLRDRWPFFSPDGAAEPVTQRGTRPAVGGSAPMLRRHWFKITLWQTVFGVIRWKRGTNEETNAARLHINTNESRAGLLLHALIKCT